MPYLTHELLPDDYPPVQFPPRALRAARGRWARKYNVSLLKPPPPSFYVPPAAKKVQRSKPRKQRTGPVSFRTLRRRYEEQAATSTSKRVLKLIRDHWRRTQTGVALAEIASAFGLSSGSAQAHLERLLRLEVIREGGGEEKGAPYKRLYRPVLAPLTPRDVALFRAYSEFYAETGTLPVLTQLAEQANINRDLAQAIVERLVERGFLIPVSYQGRSLRVYRPFNMGVVSTDAFRLYQAARHLLPPTAAASAA